MVSIIADPPQTRQRQMVVDMVHEAWGAYRQMGIAPKLSHTPGTIRGHAPELGEHTAGILAKLGVDAAAQVQLRAAKAI